ncbi:hypothetical protein NZD89_20830 [Alicyclobacillus fastidiosus]|uniref:Uncharacterized protein n=1 Tax=Alicyclobacillus fastidiosus TaxID=392011 RepID=A0ABY6ZF26_9BACL|nr:hypothetical protein [Alicyclobacillus fastidiosus]WAH40721.1 hypothetical protein NZD89_20830 [Alicyclobacillus fastidiosus]
MSIRAEGINVFPLMTRSDYEFYDELGTLSSEQVDIYQKPDATGIRSDEINFHLFNTVGKNELNQFNGLYFTSLLNRNVAHYMAIAHAIHGTSIRTYEQTRATEGQWFDDPLVDDIYKRILLVETMQTLHRINIRNALDHSSSHVYLATKHAYVPQQLHQLLQGSELTEFEPFDEELYHRREQAMVIAVEAKRLFDKHGQAVPMSMMEKTSYARFRKWSDERQSLTDDILRTEFGLYIDRVGKKDVRWIRRL